MTVLPYSYCKRGSGIKKIEIYVKFDTSVKFKKYQHVNVHVYSMNIFVLLSMDMYLRA